MKRVSRKGFTEEEWTARRKEQKRIINNKRRETHKEEIIEYRETHKEEMKQYKKNYDATHKEERKEYTQSPAGIKSYILSHWNIRGITFGDMTPSDYYDNVYLPALNCMACNKNFNNDNKNDVKCADHLHKKIPCNIRGVICNECNLHDNWKKRLTPDSIYQLYL